MLINRRTNNKKLTKDYKNKPLKKKTTHKITKTLIYHYRLKTIVLPFMVTTGHFNTTTVIYCASFIDDNVLKFMCTYIVYIHKCMCIHTSWNCNVQQYGAGVYFWITRAMSLWPGKKCEQD